MSSYNYLKSSRIVFFFKKLSGHTPIYFEESRQVRKIDTHIESKNQKFYKVVPCV